MKEVDIQDIKTRIFDAAVHLFALKSYGLVGVREIAQKAGVSISMISYHFGGKVGILEEIHARYFEVFKNMFKDAVRDDSSFEDNIRRFISGMVGLIRNKRDLSMAWFSGLSTDIPELRNVKLLYQQLMATDAKKLLGIMGLDLTRDVQMINILGGAIIHMIYSHFISSPVLTDELVQFDDAYYDRYIDIMTNLCLNGMYGVFSITK